MKASERVYSDLRKRLMTGYYPPRAQPAALSLSQATEAGTVYGPYEAAATRARGARGSVECVASNVAWRWSGAGPAHPRAPDGGTQSPFRTRCMVSTARLAAVAGVQPMAAR